MSDIPSASTPTIEIAEATISDVEHILPLFCAYREFYGGLPEVEASREYITERLILRDGVIFLAWLREGEGAVARPVGMAQLHMSYSSGALKRRWILNDLFVAPQARRIGIGRLLLERCRAFAIETRAAGLQLRTEVDNAAAQALYESCGWLRDERFYTYNLTV